MDKEKEKQSIEDYSSIVKSNSILLSLDCWGKYIEGFVKGLQSSDKVNTSCVLDCIGEILEFMNSFKPKLSKLFDHCENILEENKQLKEKLKSYETEILLIEEKDNGQDLQEL